MRECTLQFSVLPGMMLGMKSLIGYFESLLLIIDRSSNSKGMKLKDGLLLRRKAMTSTSILKSRDITLPTRSV